MTVLVELERWFAAQCNGDWEHDDGIRIETLDNPGWRVSIGLRRTALENVPFVETSTMEPEKNWIRCWVANGRFEGAGGPSMLTEILTVFLAWAAEESRLRV